MVFRLPLNAPESEPDGHLLLAKKNEDWIAARDLLSLLWDMAGLNTWYPSGPAPGLGSVYRRLAEAACDIRLFGDPRDHPIFVPDVRMGKEALDLKHKRILKRLKKRNSYRNTDRSPVLIVVGEVLDLFDSRYGGGIRLKGLSSRHSTLWAPKPLVDAMASQSSLEIEAFRSGRARLFLIAGVVLSESQNLNMVFGSFMGCSKHYIPAVGEHEIALTDALINAHRHFRKPIQHAAPSAARAPDFWLLDAGFKPVALEIFGTNTAQERRDKDHKLEILKNLGIRIWMWHVYPYKEIPELPRVFSPWTDRQSHHF